MASKRLASRGSAATSLPSSGPVVSTVLMVSAISGGIVTLVGQGRMHWPPTQLLASLNTLAGCLALVGPVLMLRKQAGETGLGEFCWATGGLILWVFDLAAVIRGETRTLVWVTPLSQQAMGLTILAVGLASWRSQGFRSNWSWTNVIGWILSIFWIVLAVYALIPARTLGLVSR